MASLNRNDILAVLNNNAALVGVAALTLGVTYKLGLWGEQNKGEDKNAGGVIIDTSKLPGQPAKYKNIADNLYSEFNSLQVTQSSKLFKMLEGLNDNELKQVYKDFGRRCSTVNALGSNICLGEKRNLFQWFEADIDDGITGNLNKMRQRWKNTGLWS